MKIGEWLSTLNRVQKTRGFKIGASIAVVIAAVIAIVAYSVHMHAPPAGASPIPSANVPDTSSTDPAPVVPGSAADTVRETRSALDASAIIIQDILASRQSVGGFTVGACVLTALALAAIWLGLGLTYLALGLAAGIFSGLSYVLGIGRTYAPLFLGVVVLTGAFLILMEVLRLALSPARPVFAIARTALAEAVRLKLSGLFIAMLIFAIAALPLLLDADQPLRYRVQSFLQYGTGGVFWLIAALIVVFSVATVAFDQRDKTIWQTMTKPVSPWQYILGKWLGVSGLAAVLLAVSGAGVFLFVEYLRMQPAKGEQSAYVLREGAEGVSMDRFDLETQVLSARRSVQPDLPQIDEKQFQENVEASVRAALATIDTYAASPEIRRGQEQELRTRITSDLRKAANTAMRSIPPGDASIFTFSGLGAARDSTRPILFRYKINAGSNMPNETYRMTLWFRGDEPQVREMVLGQFHKIQLVPAAVGTDDAIQVRISNRDDSTGRANPETVIFPPGGLEISYAAGDYRMNFLRVMSVLWVKLAFIAMVGVCMATFLSFPVASLVSFTVFFAAEGARFLLSSLDNFATEDREGKMLPIQTGIAHVAKLIGTGFRPYADLRPTGRLVDGLLLSWGDVGYGTTVVVTWTLVLFLVGCIALKRRELAIYSGH